MSLVDMSYTRKIAYNTFIQASGKIISTLLGLVTISLLLRYLGQAGYGKYTTILAFIGFFCTLTDLGLYIIHLKEVSIAKDSSKVTSNVFTLRFFSALFIIGLAPLLGFFLPYTLEVKKGLFVASISFFFISLNQILMGVFQKHFQIYKPVVVEIGVRILFLLAIYFTVKNKLSLLWIVTFLSLTSFVGFLLNFLQASSLVRIRFSFDLGYWKKILALSLPVALSIAFNLIYFKIDTILLSLMKTPNEVGIYGAAYKVLEVLITFPAMFSSLAMPVISLYALKDQKKFRQAMQKGFDFLAMLATPLAFGVFFLGARFLVFLGRKEFIESGYVLKLLVVAASFIFLGQMFSNAIVALNQQKKMVWGYLSVAVLAIILDLVLIPFWSYYGAALATIITEMIIMLISVYLVYRASRFLPHFKNFIKYLSGSLVMSLFLYFFSSLNLIILIIGGVLLYFAVLSLIGGIDRETVKSLMRERARRDEENNLLFKR